MKQFRIMQHGTKHKKVVILIGGWTYKPSVLWLTAKILEKNGYHCITYTYDDDVFTPDTEKTVTSLLTIKNEILAKIKRLKKEGYETFAVFGTSLGTSLAILVANESPDISKVILNTTSLDIAKTVWTWDTVKVYFKKDLKRQNITREKLINTWKSISPGYHLDNLKGKKLLIYLSRQDELIPYVQGEELIEQFEKRKYPYQLFVNLHLKHAFAGVWNLINAKKYLEFLSRP